MTSASKAIVVIPARYASARFPGKPLAPIAGRPMIQHVFERAKRAKGASRVVIATDDERIAAAVKNFGGEAVMTRADHRSGTDRVAEVAAHIHGEIYLNLQGDWPLVDPSAIEGVIEALQADDSVSIATSCVPISRPAEIMDPNIVKVAMDFDENALYFSRAPIPWVREAKAPVSAQHFKHIGLYGFRREALLEFPTLPPGELERLEQLEQLRWLENGYKIRVVECAHETASVDAPADVARIEELLRQRGDS